MAGSTVSRRVSEFFGVALFAAALIWLIALATYEPTDPVWFFSAGSGAQPANFAGRVGAFLAELSFQLLGYASHLIPAAMVVLGWHYFWCRTLDAQYTKLVGAGLLFGCVSSLLSLAFGSVDVAGKPFRAGGYLGEWLASWMAEYLNRTGSIIVILTLLFLAIVLSTQFSLGRMFSSATRGEPVRRVADVRRVAKLARRTQARAPAAGAAGQAGEEGREDCSGRRRAEGARRDLRLRPRSCIERGRDAPAEERRPPVMAKRPKTIENPPLPLPDPEPRQPRRNGAFTIPPLSLLDAPKTERKIDERELMEGARLLEEKCREFAVEGAVAQIHPGPVVTTFEFKPDAGVKYGKITSLADDLCLAMQAESVLIDRIPGKSTVGIQIPNHTREQISLRELLQSEMYQRSGSKLTLALGKTIHGEPYMTDLATMPHLLIAGSTGTGKSVAINSMLSSILFRATPDEVRLIMIDPKRVELGMYEDIPHLMTPVVVDPKQAVNALRWAVKEMEERYKKLAKAGVRNIEQFNRNAAHQAKDKTAAETEELLMPLPYIVVVIDELADLMMVARGDVEESIARLAQMARAVGVHLLLATQRPSVDVITGPHQGEPPVAHLVPRAVEDRLADDSRRQRRRTAARARRHAVHAAGVVARRAPARPVHLRTGEREARELPAKAGQARSTTRRSPPKKRSSTASRWKRTTSTTKPSRIVVSSGQASISYLQRRLRIGFSRAARLVDMMEMDGLVSPGVGGKPREVLVDKAYFDEVDAQLR